MWLVRNSWSPILSEISSMYMIRLWIYICMYVCMYVSWVMTGIYLKYVSNSSMYITCIVVNVCMHCKYVCMAWRNATCVHWIIWNHFVLRSGLDTTTRDFDSDDTKVTTYPKPLYNGFTRNISVSFTVQQPQKRSVIAFIEVNDNCIKYFSVF